MKTNPVKRTLSEGKPAFGTWLSLGDLFATRLLARMGFAWLTLDLEHGAIDWSQAATIFAAISDAGTVPLARVPKGNHDYIKRTLDAGAWGIVVPMVDTVEQAKIAIAAAKYPPIGNRSLRGVDAIFIAPVDLRAQMRKPDGSEASDEAFEAMIQKVIAVGKKTGTPT